MNNSSKSDLIMIQKVPFLINRIELLINRIELLIKRIGVCRIQVIPIRNRIDSVNIPYEPNSNRIFQNRNEASTLKVIIEFSAQKNLILNFYIGTYSTNKLL